ncbi:MAG: NrpR regulatory domain-containing protein [Planctomycetia bacterium]|nr:NrpR regulatory domain-containing protein [Planctomycetia bacterium]
MPRKDPKKIALLRVLKEEEKPLTSARMMDILATAGIHWSERSVRLYLQSMDKQGWTIPHGRKGRTITPEGLRELQGLEVVNRLGYLSAKIDQMTYRMTFDLPTCSGGVVVNTSLLPVEEFVDSVEALCEVFEHGYGMGRLVSLLQSGETFGEFHVPKGFVGFCTVCSITLNGVLLKHGIPIASRFSGLLELQEGRPIRFAEIINYDATTIDPLEIFIRAGMTNNLGVLRDGCGMIGAAFRELPAESRQHVEHLLERLEQVGLGGFLKIGLPNQPILDIPVSEGRMGAIVVGGLNPLAVLEESHRKIYQSGAISGLMEYHRLFPYDELPQRVKVLHR